MILDEYILIALRGKPLPEIELYAAMGVSAMAFERAIGRLVRRRRVVRYPAGGAFWLMLALPHA